MRYLCSYYNQKTQEESQSFIHCRCPAYSKGCMTSVSLVFSSQTVQIVVQMSQTPERISNYINIKKISSLINKDHGGERIIHCTLKQTYLFQYSCLQMCVQSYQYPGHLYKAVGSETKLGADMLFHGSIWRVARMDTLGILDFHIQIEVCYAQATELSV